MSILCGTDLSENGARSLAAGEAIARRLGEKLVAAHVLELPPSPAIAEEFEWSVKERVRHLLRKEALRLRGGEPDADIAILNGPADQTLATHAAAVKARFIVVSALGRRSGGWWRLGSTTERLAAASPVPLLVVRDAGPFEQWSLGKRPLRALLAVGQDATSAAAARWLGDLRRAGPVDVTVVRTYDSVAERRRLGLGGAPFAKGPRPDAEKVIEKEMKDLVGELPGEGSVAFVTAVAEGDPGAHVARLGSILESDLIVFGTHQRRGLDLAWRGSASYRVLSEAPCAVALVPAGGEAPASGRPRVHAALAATDFSETGNRAVEYAHLLCPVYGAVHVLHVLEVEEDRLLDPLHGAPRAASPGERARIAQDLAARLSALVPEWGSDRGIDTRIEVVEARSAAEAIRQAAERTGADMVCLGTHGRRGLSKALFGSVAERVLRESRVPVFVTKPPPRE